MVLFIKITHDLKSYHTNILFYFPFKKGRSEFPCFSSGKQKFPIERFCSPNLHFFFFKVDYEFKL